MRVAMRFQWMIFLVAGLVLALAPAQVTAQEQDPLRLVYINLGGSTGAESYETVRSLLEESPQIELVESDVFLNIAADYDLGRNIFRRYNRGDYEDELASVMWRTRIEGILVHDMLDRGGRVSVAVIGPRGWQMDEVERGLVDETLDMDTAISMLQDIFGVLVPEVRGFRRQIDEGELSSDDFEMPDDIEPDPEFEAERAAHDDDEDEDDDDDDDWLSDRSDRTPGTVERGGAVRVGALIGRRALTMDQDAGDFILNHTTSLLGPSARFDGVFATLEEDTIGIGGAVFFGMAPFLTTFDEAELSGQFMRIGAEVRYIDARVDEDLLLRGIVGFETANLTLEENAHYTGHGYLFGRVGGGLQYSVEEMATLEFDLLFMPVVSASNSGGAYGEASGWLGAGAEAAVYLDMLDPFLVSLDYHLHYNNIAYPEPLQLDVGANSQDMLHQVMLSVGYRLGW